MYRQRSFFKKITGAAKDTRIVAVLPQTVDESRQYLEKLGVRVDDLKSAPLAAISVGGTPTMMLVDSKGIIRNVWVGKLSNDRQSEVLSAIGAKP